MHHHQFSEAKRGKTYTAFWRLCGGKRSKNAKLKNSQKQRPRSKQSHDVAVTQQSEKKRM